MLVRTGKDDESFELCEQVKKVIPTDEATLQAVTMALKELGKRKCLFMMIGYLKTNAKKHIS